MKKIIAIICVLLTIATTQAQGKKKNAKVQKALNMPIGM